MSQSKALLVIYISVAISYLGVGLVAPLIAIVLSEHGADPFIIGLVGTTMFAAFTAASFPIGAVTDSLGPKPVLIAGLVIYGTSILLFALIEDTPLFFLVRAVEGVGAAAISVATETMISRLSAPTERARCMSYYALSVGLGWAAGPIAGTTMFALRRELPFAACFALSVIAAALAATLIPKTGSNSHQVAGILSVVSSRMLVPISSGALYGYLMSSLVTLFPLYLKALTLEEKEMGIIITAVILGTLISQVPIGRAADRFGKRRTLLVCAVVLGTTFVAIPYLPDWRHLIVLGALTGAMAGGLYPIGLSIVGGVVSSERLGAATSLFSLAFGVGSLIGPALSGLAMKNFGSRWLFFLPSLLVAAFCLELISLYRKTVARRRAAS